MSRKIEYYEDNRKVWNRNFEGDRRGYDGRFEGKLIKLFAYRPAAVQQIGPQLSHTNTLIEFSGINIRDNQTQCPMNLHEINNNERLCAHIYTYFGDLHKSLRYDLWIPKPLPVLIQHPGPSVHRRIGDSKPLLLMAISMRSHWQAEFYYFRHWLEPNPRYKSELMMDRLTIDGSGSTLYWQTRGTAPWNSPW